jgi:PAS domain S-box-containing protein
MTERTSWEAELRASEARKAAILDSVFDCIITIDHEGRIIEFNRAAERTFGHSRVEVLGRRAVDVIVPPAQRSPQGDAFAPLFATEASLGERRETTGVRKDGSEFPMELAVTPVPLAQRRLYTVCLHDITERKQIEAEFRQAQKMEAVGRLAGGVAHDFNNLLNVIGGYAELLLRQLPADGPLHKKAGEIARAAEKAAALTRQLLAFSRKQVLQPRVVDMNVIVGDVERMLARLIGENIELRTDLDAALGRLRADPGQMEQVLTNLVVNARDALPKGGRITITTRNVALDERFTREHPGSRPGPHVMLQVSDTGVGMDAETLRHVFEPFFSTKAKGKGTGLGLAMVYGIVKQSQGYIWVDSQPGRGATFQIYLPRVDEPAEAAQPAVHGAGATGSETILLVEDEDVLRMMASEVLEASGYTVLEASGGEEAVRVSESHAGPIHLLVTDVIMPGISGPEVAQRLAASRPGMKVLYASGYTDDAIAQHGVLDAATAFLQKPYNASALETKVREILDSA